MQNLGNSAVFLIITGNSYLYSRLTPEVIWIMEKKKKFNSYFKYIVYKRKFEKQNCSSHY